MYLKTNELENEPMAKRTMTAARNDEATVTEAAVVLKNAKTVRIDLMNQVEGLRSQAEEIRAKLRTIAEEHNELASAIALAQSRLSDHEIDLNYARQTAQLTAGSPVAAASQRRFNELTLRHTDLTTDLASVEAAADERTPFLDRAAAKLEAELARVTADEATISAELEVIKQREVEAREEHGREILRQLESDIAEAEETHRRAKSEAADAYQRVLELRMSAKNKLAGFDLSDDAERLSPQYEAPISPVERVFRAQHDYLAALIHAGDARWNDALRLPGSQRQAQQTLIELLSLSPAVVADYLNGRGRQLEVKARDADGYASMARENLSTPRRNG